MEKGDEIRGNGKLSVIYVEADNLAEATYKTILACANYGSRVELIMALGLKHQNIKKE